MITAHQESFTDRLAELKPLLPIHWEELALNKDSVPLDPQFDIYIEREARGEVIFTTLRSAGELVGYFIGFIAPGLHYKTCLTCTMDIFYLRKELRGMGGGKILFSAVETELKRRGVQRWFVGSKLHKDVGKFFESIGFAPVETYYSMMLGD